MRLTAASPQEQTTTAIRKGGRCRLEWRSSIDTEQSDLDTFGMEVHLSLRQEAFIQRRIRDCRFATPDEAVQAAVALLEQQECLELSRRSTSRKSLVQLFAESPFNGLDMEFPRDTHPLRDPEL
jgi:Arc/MetJ-type ribon-helix-helix transcriptional regulator